MSAIHDNQKELLESVKKKRGNKYGAKKCLMNGIVFDSQAEAARYVELHVQYPGLHRNQNSMNRQTCFVFKCGVKYKSDFDYWLNNKHIVEDTKGFITPAFRIKKKLMLQEYGIEITVIKMDSKKVQQLLAIGAALFAAK